MTVILLAAVLFAANASHEDTCRVAFKDALTGEEGASGWISYAEARDVIRLWSRVAPTIRGSITCRGEYRI